MISSTLRAKKLTKSIDGWMNGWIDRQRVAVAAAQESRIESRIENRVEPRFPRITAIHVLECVLCMM